MNITEVRIRMVKKTNDSKLSAVASITIDDCFVVHDIKIIKSSDGYFITMPSKKTPHGEFKDIVHPIKNDTRDFLRDTILAAYNKEIEKLEA